MIECRTKGIPMREGTRVDAEGYHVFNLDESKHDPFETFARLCAAVDKAAGHDPKRDAERDARYAGVICAQRMGCTQAMCATSDECSMLKGCAVRIAAR